MTYIVTNCFQWVGFHLVKHLLNQGCHVVGFDEISSEKKEVLSMFFGRNDLFSLNPNKLSEQQYETTVLVDASLPKQTFNSKRTIQLSYDTITNEQESSIVTIKLPLLFGEWMEMNEEGFYYKNDFIRFDSEQFLSEAIYIDDFIQCLLQVSKSDYLSQALEIKSSVNKKMNGDNPKKSIYVRDNKPIQENLKVVQSHYNKFRKLYSVI
ncbi:hypothetical protein [Virgibacillus ndiopensis]|uniref:hypothetical protein n=1 Tax=Virgibacillus ndiopensis TaxID=2004408 RepID=UPI000C081757|nr:hypothetical protein [Virgibacillus ndiopensis]